MGSVGIWTNALVFVVSDYICLDHVEFNVAIGTLGSTSSKRYIGQALAAI